MDQGGIPTVPVKVEGVKMRRPPRSTQYSALETEEGNSESEVNAALACK